MKKDATAYTFTIEKSKVCCLIGDNNAEKTKILEMLAGERLSNGTVEIRDSEFFAKGNKPKLSSFMAYRSTDIVLEENLTAIQHLEMFSHLRGGQLCRNTRILCEKLLPEHS